MAQQESKAPAWSTENINLLDDRLGARVLFATDEWFARSDNLLKHAPAVFDPDAFCEQGKVMDGWESRRRRLPGHDWNVIKLALPGFIKGFEVDTAWFTGNQTPKISIQATELPNSVNDGDILPGAKQRLEAGGGKQGTANSPETIAEAEKSLRQFNWFELLPTSNLRPGYPDQSVHFFEVPAALSNRRVTHIRLNYFPDGGVARLRAWGDVSRDFDNELVPWSKRGAIDLASIMNGGKGVACSNQHYGVPTNILQPGRGVDMGDGWETARHPDRPAVVKLNPKTGLSASHASDWCVIRLGAVCGDIERIILDTNHFRGNFPESVLLEACCEPMATPDDFKQKNSRIQWFELVGRTRCEASKEHVFDRSCIKTTKPISHIRLTIFPDGGVMRLRVMGRAVAPIGRPVSKL